MTNRREPAPESYASAPALRRLSQNFLAEDSVARRMVAALGATANDHLLEVGPGRAALTRHLLATSSRVVAVELDRRLHQRLSHDLPVLELHHGDILEHAFKSFRSGPRLRIISSLPFQISSPFVRKLALEREDYQVAIVLFQAEFADRLVALSGTHTYGALSVFAQSFLTIEPLFTIPPSAFRPRPKVAARLLRITPRAEVGSDALAVPLERLLKSAFAGRRKRIVRALSIALDRPREELLSALAAAGIDPDLRPEVIPVEQWLKLAGGALSSGLTAG